MRDIKFRGKYVEGGPWKYGHLVACFGYAYIYTVTEGETSPTAYRVTPATVGQYTGLKDKDGAEIYEGDLIEFRSGISTCFGSKPTGKESVHVDVIEWMGVECKGAGRGCWGVRLVDADDFNKHKIGSPVSSAIHVPIHLYGKVIGTIHDGDMV